MSSSPMGVELYSNDAMVSIDERVVLGEQSASGASEQSSTALDFPLSTSTKHSKRGVQESSASGVGRLWAIRS